MPTYQSVLNSLQAFLPGHKSYLKVLSGVIIAILHTRDVNLVKLSAYQASNAQEASQYRKLQRFFQKWALPWKELAQLTLSKIPKPKLGYVLSMDRTNWQFGKTHINILVIGVVVRKISMPLAWSTLPQATKRGNSKAKQRIALMRRVLKALPVEDIHCLTMDREFNGHEWLEWLNEQGITWVLRLRKNTLIDERSAYKFKKTRKSKQFKKRQVFGFEAYFGVATIKNGQAEYLYVLSNNLPPLEALETYKMRWSIEVFFGHLKKKGFNFENTHMSKKHKMNKLMAVLVLAFILSVSWGLILKESRSLTVYERRKSIFRLGLDYICAMYAKPDHYKEMLEKFDQLISGQIKPLSFVV